MQGAQAIGKYYLEDDWRDTRQREARYEGITGEKKSYMFFPLSWRVICKL